MLYEGYEIRRFANSTCRFLMTGGAASWVCSLTMRIEVPLSTPRLHKSEDSI